jgi:hypothetical protein
MTRKPFGPKIAKMIANKEGSELAYRGISVRSWAETELIVTGNGVVVARDTKTGSGLAYCWNGRRFAYLGAR